MRPALLLLPLILLSSHLGCEEPLHKGKPMKLSRFYKPLPAEDPLQGNIVPVHDPSLTRLPDGTYMVVDTDIPFLRSDGYLEERCSGDLGAWHGCGFIFSEMPRWVRDGFPEASGLWAPEIAYFGGTYHLYYAVSKLGSQHSAIGQATNVTLDPKDPRYKWVDAGEVFESETGGDFNAIDPAILVASDGKVWMSYGSFWKGIFQQEVDPQTGMLVRGGRRYQLAEQPVGLNGAIEGSASVEHNGWFYLFASVGVCCAIPIENDTYQQIVGRSRNVHGPFEAEDGSKLLKGGGTILLTGDAHWIGPGGGSVWQSPDEKETLFTFHALNRAHNGALDLWVERIDWQDDWPVLVPVR